MARPRPLPPVRLLREGSSRWKGRNTASRSDSGMPGPRSSTQISTPSECAVLDVDRLSVAVADGVVDQIGEDALERQRPDAQAAVRSLAAADLDAGVSRRFLKQVAQVEFDRVLLGKIVAHLQAAGDQVVHALDVAQHAVDEVAVGFFRSMPSASWMRASGVRRSCEMPASRVVRLASRSSTCSPMRLNSRARVASSAGPVSASGSGRRPWPMRCVALTRREAARSASSPARPKCSA